MINIREMFPTVSRRGGVSHCDENEVVCSVRQKTKSDGRRSIAYTIGEKVMRSLRWVPGDRVTIDLDLEQSEALIRRVVDQSVPSWKLVAAKKVKHCGISRCYVAITACDDLIKAFGLDNCTRYVCEKVSTSESGLRVSLAKIWTVNRINKRKEDDKS